MILNLNEDWKKAYSDYLKEQDEALSLEIDNTFSELSEAQESAQKSFSMLREYYEVFALSEGIDLLTEAGEAKEGETWRETKNGGAEKVSSEKREKDYSRPSAAMLGMLNDALKNDNGDDNTNGYKAIQTVEVTGIQDMKFPKNIIFFIGQLIKWIRNLVLYFIEKFKNLIRRLVGEQPRELDPESIKLKLEQVKKLETISTAIGSKAAGGVASVRKLNDGALEQILKEDLASTLGIVKPSNKEAVKTQPVIVTFDLSRDIQNIRTLTDHFYKLFDNAYGSSNEHLFGTDDLEVILNIFNDTISRLKTGNIAQYSVSGGTAIEAPGVNSQRVKQNLQVTNTNLIALKNAYTQTAEKIMDISKIIHSKEMMMLSDIGATYRMLSTSTYSQISSVLETIPARMKKAAEMEKKLAKMKGEYSKLVQELQSMQRSFAAVSNVTFDTIYNRKVVDLLNAASWMSDTVTLRLTGIGLYIKELKDVRDALVMVSDLNAAPRGGKLKDFIEQGQRANLSRKLYKNY